MIAWLGLLALGIWGAIQNRQAHTFSIGLGLMLLANGLLHSVYGEVTFLYAMHVIPMLTVLAAMSWFSPPDMPAWHWPLSSSSRAAATISSSFRTQLGSPAKSPSCRVYSRYKARKLHVRMKKP